MRETIYRCDRCDRQPGTDAIPMMEGQYVPGPGQTGGSGPLSMWRVWDVDRRRIDAADHGEAFRVELCSACDDELGAWLPTGERLNHHHLPVT